MPANGDSANGPPMRSPDDHLIRCPNCHSSLLPITAVFANAIMFGIRSRLQGAWMSMNGRSLPMPFLRFDMWWNGYGNDSSLVGL